MSPIGRRSGAVLGLLFLAWLGLAVCIGTVREIGNQDGDISPQDGHRITLWESIQNGARHSMGVAALAAPFMYLGFFAGCAWMDTRQKEYEDEWRA